MTLPQFGIFAQGTIAHEFLEFDIRPDVELPAIGEVATVAPGPGRLGGRSQPRPGLRGRPVAGHRPDDAPADLAPFQPVGQVGGHHLPASQHDLWLWINGSSRDVVFEHARAAALGIADVAVLATDVPGFVHRDSRDLTGFIDGTANPMLLEAPAAALVPDDQRGAGGSHVIAIRWVHDLVAFNALPVADQERVFGRTKPDSNEFTGDALPTGAHIARVQIEDEAGDEVPIYRRSVPYGTTRSTACSSSRSAPTGRDSTACCADVRHDRRRAPRPAARLLAPGQRRVLLRPVAHPACVPGRASVTVVSEP